MLKQTVFLQLSFNASTKVSKDIFCQFQPDYVVVKQVTFASDDVKSVYAVQSGMIDGGVLAIFRGDSDAQPGLFFPLNQPVNGSQEFTLTSSASVGSPTGILFLALEFNKIK